ncbi:dihydroorotate dehydrogenase [Paenibacillus cymbidii]|uniref:hypothetical protein n=1 Tax=Paenibacillus cymbidii TaxID=1639034 RepID=UPI0010807A0E|nr:hypothetical protein [Paenibacillus cymbidii]
MPDWSYRTLFQPLLSGLSAERARALTLGAMGALSRLPGGTFVIRTMGHMELSPILEDEVGGVPLRYPVGLSGCVDPHGVAQKALSPFGFGYYEIGPVSLQAIRPERAIGRDLRQETLLYPEPYANDGADAIVARLQRGPGHALPLMVRIRPMPGLPAEAAAAELLQLMERFEPFAAGFFVDAFDEARTPAQTANVLAQLTEGGRRLFLYVPPDCTADRLLELLDGVDMKRWSGVVIGDAVSGVVPGEPAVVGRSAKEPGERLLRLIRERYGAEPALIAACGVHEPQDALELMAAGANAVQLHSGLVFSGPGLPKRINEAVIYERIRDEEPPPAPSFWSSWGWMCLLGLGMIVGGAIAWLIAGSSVVLPYDEAFLDMLRGELEQANGRLLPFMSHDRITLAGTMLSIGILYYQLGRHGLRRELHWAKTALLASGVVGFSSFFLYLGYGYFDPLHAAAAAILLPMFVLAMRRPADRPSRKPPGLRNDRDWQLAMWGQLMLVSLGFALAVGGLVIAGVGITRVFVPTDLTFLCASAEALAELNDRLLPLIAHDRAGFGGALFSDAVAILAASLWGIQRGERWLWLTLLAAGLPGFAAGISVHLTIGYTDFIHLLPAYAAIALFVAGLALLYPYMMKPAGRQANNEGSST